MGSDAMPRRWNCGRTKDVEGVVDEALQEAQAQCGQLCQLCQPKYRAGSEWDGDQVAESPYPQAQVW